jgi:hypothetical protein
MTINAITSDIAKAKQRPKGIKVSEETWKKLKNADLIKMKDVAAWGVFDLGFQLPFLDGDICVIVDPELETRDLDYELPPCVHG